MAIIQKSTIVCGGVCFVLCLFVCGVCSFVWFCFCVFPFFVSHVNGRFFTPQKWVDGTMDLSLLFIFAIALSLTGFGFWRFFFSKHRMTKPLFKPKWYINMRRDVTVRLVVGGVLFGVGWGLSGHCPGPALASCWGGCPHAILVTSTQIVTWVLYHYLVTNKQNGKVPPDGKLKGQSDCNFFVNCTGHLLLDWGCHERLVPSWVRNHIVAGRGISQDLGRERHDGHCMCDHADLQRNCAWNRGNDVV
jgi:uncharacterized membrane protein YedE/YeeE